jgi:alpha-tubulin suppressor-like RCC1 family protein
MLDSRAPAPKPVARAVRAAWRAEILALAVVACGGSDSTGPGGPVATLEITPASPTVLTDDQLTLAATLKDANGTILTGRTVAWSSGNASVATVSSAGVVTPVLPGDATITATSEGKSVTATVAVRLRFVRATLGVTHSCALTAAGAAWCWGRNADGELGIGASSADPQLTPLPVAGGLRFKAITAGQYYTCAVALDGGAWCWGENEAAQLGNGNQGVERKLTPTQVLGGNTFVALTAGISHTCGLTGGGLVLCWGMNVYGAVNGFPGDPVATPAAVLTGPGSFVAVSAGDNFTCAVASDDDGAGLWCWGDNSSGQLGQPPGKLLGVWPVTDLVRAGLSAGGDHTCAVGFRQIDSQTLEPSGMCWGSNSYGTLQDADPSKQRTFPPLQGALSIASGSDMACAVAGNGSLACWGGNFRGELGRGTMGGSDAVPQAVALDATFTRVFSGPESEVACGLTTAGLLYCWGTNAWGTLGDGTTSNRSVPTLVAGQQ